MPLAASHIFPLMGVWTAAWAALGQSVPPAWAGAGLAVILIHWGWWVETCRRKRLVPPQGVWSWVRFYFYRWESAALGLAVAACVAGGRAGAVEIPPLDGWIGTPIEVEARVTAVLPRIPGVQPAVEAELVRLYPDGGGEVSAGGAKVRMGIDVPVVAGDWIRAWVLLAPPPAPRAPFPHGVADPWERADLLYRAELKSSPMVHSTWRSVPGKLRSALERTWSGRVDPASEPLLKAMVLGDTTDLDPALNEAFALTGVAHVVAVSGAHLHVVLWPLRRWLARRTSPWARFRLLGGVGLGYALLTGGSPSAMRAAVMVTYLAAGEALGRRPGPLHAWGATLAAESLLRPQWVFDLGFQLSYAAVWGIFVLSSAIRTALGRGPEWVLGPLAVAVAAEIAICPISFSSFYVWNGWTFLANLWVPHAGALLLGAGLLSLLLASLPLVGDGAMWIADFLARIIIQGVMAMDGDRRWLFRLGELPMLIWLLYAGGVLAALNRWGGGRRTGRFCMVLFSVVVFLSVRVVPEQMVVFALPGGSAVFVESKGARELICGNNRQDVETVVIPYLRRLGVHQLDRLWLAPALEPETSKAEPSEDEPGLEVLERRLTPRRVLVWDDSQVMRVNIGHHPVWVGNWPLQILVPGRLVVDVRLEQPLPGFTGLERRWSTKAQSGLLIQSQGDVVIRGTQGPVSSGPVSTSSHRFRLAFPGGLPWPDGPLVGLGGLETGL